ncbi:MAG: DUF1254 domain-containing protein [Rhizobiales bacterium]|jgi:hypothetical protein|nr:DUF1254 domain-containing protein [Hyphomicrobiales bacterium]
MFTHQRVLATLFAAGIAVFVHADVLHAQAMSQEQVRSLARDLYLYAYPIVSMDTTMRQATNVPDATSVNMRAPVNQFAHVRSYPPADAKEVVRINFDTLYSSAWLDLSREPIVLSVPDTSGRYYLLEMLDMWTDVFSVVGSRTTGTKTGVYAIVPPGWNGALPQGVATIIAPTSRIWIIGRTQTNGPADYAAVHTVQDGYKLTPLSQWGGNYVPPQGMAADPSVDNRTPPKIQVDRLDGVAMLTRLAELMSQYPPHANDYPILFGMRAFGLEPGKPFDASKLDPTTIATINSAAKEMLEEMSAGLRRMGTHVNGWNLATDNIGTYGTSYYRRAIIALGGLGANLPEDAIYPTAFVDGSGQPLTGAHKYVLHFAKGQTPPANAFWSITMYDKDGFQVPNPINRFALGDRDPLKLNPDGSFDIYVQAESPGAEKEANWLPAPRDSFQPTMRIYSPRPEVVDGRWVPPPFRRVEQPPTVGQGAN